MILKTKLKLWFTVILTVLLMIGYFIFNTPVVQKKLFDIKADVIGTHRVVTFYSNIDATKVASFEDKDVRFETEPNGTISIWLGSKDRKIKSNMNYIIEDVK